MKMVNLWDNLWVRRDMILEVNLATKKNLKEGKTYWCSTLEVYVGRTVPGSPTKRHTKVVASSYDWSEDTKYNHEDYVTKMGQGKLKAVLEQLK